MLSDRFYWPHDIIIDAICLFWRKLCNAYGCGRVFCLRLLLICFLMRRRLLCAFLLGLLKINGMSYAGACCLVVTVTIAIVIGVSWIVQNKIYKYLCKFVNRIVEKLEK